MGWVNPQGAFTGGGRLFQILNVTQMFMDISYLLATGATCAVVAEFFFALQG